MADQGYQIHIVGPGDTIQAIGDVYGVDWAKIVTVNGLVYPYINTEPESGDNHVPSGVAGIGRALIVPTGTLMFPIRTNGDVLDVEKYVLGADLDIYNYIETDNHVLRVGDPGELMDDLNGDLLLAEGMRNLRQQLVTRLGCPKGTLLLHPEYGSDILKYTGKQITPELLIDMKLCVQECLLLDSRVESLSALSVQAENSKTYVDVIVHAIKPFGDFRLQALVSEAGAELLNP